MPSSQPTIDTNQELLQPELIDPYRPEAVLAESSPAVPGLASLEDALLGAIGFDRASELERKDREELWATILAVMTELRSALGSEETVVRTFVSRDEKEAYPRSAASGQRKCSSKGYDTVTNSTQFDEWLVSGDGAANNNVG